jgi:ribulose-phosphate 3-epimerase
VVEILPSILAADFARLGEHVAQVEAAGCRMLHVDVMDGHFVPNISFGFPILESLRKVTRMTLDVHLMIADADHYAPMFIEAGADQISVHQEACPHLNRTLHMIQGHGAKAGVVLNPGTPVSTLEEVLDVLDFVLLMSVNPGFGGQQFIASVLPKITEARRRIKESGRDIWLEVDGGVKPDNIAQIARAGADTFVAGSAVFGSRDYAATIRDLRARLSVV